MNKKDLHFYAHKKFAEEVLLSGKYAIGNSKRVWTVSWYYVKDVCLMDIYDRIVLCVARVAC